jgi:hypothetical protein
MSSHFTFIYALSKFFSLSFRAVACFFNPDSLNPGDLSELPGGVLYSGEPLPRCDLLRLIPSLGGTVKKKKKKKRGRSVGIVRSRTQTMEFNLV